MKILFTGFEPFGGDAVNPSWEAVRLIPETVSGAEIIRLRLPVSYDRAGALLGEAIRQERPDAVVCVGQAGGRAKLTPEKVAINWKDAAIADNDGLLCAGEPIDPAGETAYFSTLPVKAIVAAMEREGVPAALSYSAGAYVCNCTMYRLLALLSREFPDTRGGFIHIPFECGQTIGRPAGTPSLPLLLMARGLTAAAKAIAQDCGAQE